MDIFKPFSAIGDAFSQFFRKNDVVTKVVDLSELPVEILGGSFRLRPDTDPRVRLTAGEAPKGRHILTGDNYTLEVLNDAGQWKHFPLAQKFSFTVTANGLAHVEVEFLDIDRKDKPKEEPC